MLIITEENTTLDLNLLGNKNGDVRYGVFDHSNPKESDYYFRPLTFLESFNDCALDFTIGNTKLKMPKEWSVVMGDPSNGDIEIVAVEEINNRDFHVFSINPHTGFYPKFLPIKLEDLFIDLRWVFPKLNQHNFLLIPLQSTPNPDCILLINEKDQKKIPTLNLEMLL